MVDMQVRAQHGVDVLAQKAGFGKVGKKVSLSHVPVLHCARLVVADAGIHHDRAPLRLDHERMDRADGPAVRGEEMRLEPGVLQQSLGRRCVERKVPGDGPSISTTRVTIAAPIAQRVTG